MRIADYKKDLYQKNKGLEEKIKEDLSFQVGREFERVRIAKGFTQSQLAKKTGTKQPNIARLENGAFHHNTRFLQKVAKSLGTYVSFKLKTFSEADKIHFINYSASENQMESTYVPGVTVLSNAYNRNNEQIEQYVI